MSVSREAEMYPPLRDYLVAQGYLVRAEVRDCDITARKDGELVIVEMKRGLTIDLLAQAAMRQRAADAVYVAVPRPASGIHSKRWRRLRHLLRRLELGLLLVTPGPPPTVQLACHPLPLDRRRRPAERRAIIREAAARSGDHNQGGSTGQPLMTAYREQALRIACCLAQSGAATPKQLRAAGTGAKTTPILYANHYGWFERVGRGVYEVSAAGRAALSEYADLTAQFRQEQH